MSQRARDVRVGLFILAALVLLGVLITSLSSQSGLFRDTYSIKTSFNNVVGLVEGAPVRLQGTSVGLVSKIYFAPGFGEKPIEVIMDVDESVRSRIRENSTATIRTMGLLGDKYIEVTQGSPPEPIITEGGTVASARPADLATVMSKGDEILTNIVNISESLDSFTAEFATDENRENFTQTFESMKNIMSEVEEGDGLLHGLIYEPKPGDAIDSLTGALTDLRALIGDAKDGKGEIGETLRALSESITNFEEITARIRSGPGMLHEAVYTKGDESLMANLNSAAENLNEILVKINEGEGTFGAFLNDPTLYEDLKIITGGAKRSGRVKRVVEYTIKKYDKKKEETPAATP